MLTPPDLTGQVAVSHKISEGVFAEVFVGHLSGAAVAVKIPRPSKKGAARAAEREIRAMQYVATLSSMANHSHPLTHSPTRSL